ncbi:hypothetical protein [Sporohalobacter salinus]|uniref:hypothetical protein n=1 Tax=Sporohalobacter salinus TaxID=1494606 RepID=UPI001960F1E5|nr:hypothetical protein [Sporohalobacter salinus]MBM7623722.1 hypothetical protein [Sporohalobacter salinus]
MYCTVDEVLQAVSIEPMDLGLEDDQDLENGLSAEEKLNNLIEDWIKEVTSEINIRLGAEVPTDHEAYAGIKGLVKRKCGDLISLALQKQNSPVVQIDDFAVDIVDSSTIFKNLDKELRPYKKVIDSKEDGEDTAPEIFIAGVDVDV